MVGDGLEMKVLTGFRQSSALSDSEQYSLYLQALHEYTFCKRFGVDYLAVFPGSSTPVFGGNGAHGGVPLIGDEADFDLIPDLVML